MNQKSEKPYGISDKKELEHKNRKEPEHKNREQQIAVPCLIYV